MIRIFFVSFLVCAAVNSLCLFLGRRTRCFEFLKDKASKISKAGGLGLVFAFFISLSAGPFVDVPLVLPVGFVLTFILGLFDDAFVLTPARKFSVQVLIAAFFVAGGIRTQIVFLPELLNVLISLLWIVGIMNAFNFLDILDGLAAGINIVLALVFVVISIMTRNPVVGAMAMSLFGANLAFLFFNFPRARLYMGDTGSLFNGVVFAAMSILVSYARPGREPAVFLPLLILALPLVDLCFLVVMRLARRRPLAQKSADHFALRLVAGGVSKVRAVLMMYFFAIFFSASAVLFLGSSRLFWPGVLVLGFTAGLWGVTASGLSKVRVEDIR